MFADRLLKWYAAAKRPMPWRLSPAPYACWLSEIMMQQTTYTAVLPYYERFLNKFPTVEFLAAAEESEVLKAWEGLGYYARARNLHKAARQLCSTGSVRWPRGVAAWAEVPGIGPYTAAALASVLDGDQEPVVDGNVARVFARYWCLEEDFHKLPARQQLAERLRPVMVKATKPFSLCRTAPGSASLPGDFNQAMMELGALVCTPSTPRCGECPLARECAAFKTGRQAEYPRKAARKELPIRKMTAIVVTDEKGRVLLVKNREGGLLKGLWELPLVEPAGEQVQIFSHFRLELTTLRAKEQATFQDPGVVPLSTSTRKVLVRCGLL